MAMPARLNGTQSKFPLESSTPVTFAEKADWSNSESQLLWPATNGLGWLRYLLSGTTMYGW